MAENPPDPPENPALENGTSPALVPTGRVIIRDLKQELSSSYIDYAMSVIIGRAIPDIRDGMKPVQRRILYSMYVNNFFYNRPHHKSATIVGHVIGHYHPHGDMAVYDALVRMAQEFSMRFPLIDGQGNFGSIDGDAPAAYRYTEARLAQIAGELLEDLDKDTVNFIETFDGSEKEPAYLPAKLPALLLNGATGIAVGMSTNIAPHNLNEIVDAVCAAIDMNPANFTPIEALKYIKGPDFPTGATIIGRQGIVDAITTGRGSIIVRAKAEILTEGKRDVIIVSEIPYMLNKARLIEIIAEHVNKGDIPEIADVRDESDRKGMRIYIELKKGVDSNACLNKLYMKTPMQSSFGIINLALVNNGKKPKICNYAEIIQEFIAHREDVVKRRTQFELKKAQDRLHIIEGLLIAINNIDAVVKLIRKSANISDATQGLMTQFSLSEIQAGEILKMPLSRLTNLQTQKLVEEDTELKAKVKEYQDILGDRNRILGIIKAESLEIAAKYGNPRRTQIEEGEASVRIDYKETVPDEDCVIILTKDQQIKRMTLLQYQAQNRGGKGKRGVQMREEDFVQEMFIAHSHDTILLFTQEGRVYSIPAYIIPVGSRTSRGKAVVNYVNLQPNEHVIDIVNISDFEAAGLSLVFVSSRGIII
jgi:DNA gyrase subunit A